MEKVYTTFEGALALGEYNQGVLAHEFIYQGIPVRQTEGKNDFDLYLPDGRTVEIKMDVRHQCTGAGAIEKASLDRMADFYIQTFTFARAYTFTHYQTIFNRGKIPDQGFGPQRYDGRYDRGMSREGLPLQVFINQLKQKAA